MCYFMSEQTGVKGNDKIDSLASISIVIVEDNRGMDETDFLNYFRDND